MKKFFILLTVSLSIFFTGCLSGFHSSLPKSALDNFDISFEDSGENGLIKVTVSGTVLDSALSIGSYKITYEKNKVRIDVDRCLKQTGISRNYLIQFLMNPEVSQIYIGKNLLWTSSAETYFEDRNLEFPVNFEKKLDSKSQGMDGEFFLSDKEIRELEKFADHIEKELTVEKCRAWNKTAVAFDVSGCGIFIDAGKKYFTLNVYAYEEGSDVYDRWEKVGKNNLTVLYNVLLFDYDSYEERGWVF